MESRTYRKHKEHQLPKEKENMKHVTLTEINPYYELYEDGSIFSKIRGIFLRPQNNKGKQVYIVKAPARGMGFTTLSITQLLRDYFYDKTAPQLEGVEHKPMIGYEGIYQIYSNGQVWSFVKCKWMTACLQSKKRYYLYCLQDAEGKVTTKYVHRLIAENFILNGPLPNKYQIHHKDHNPKNNSVENLQVLAPLEHQQLHKDLGYHHSPQWLERKAEKDRIKQLERQEKLKHGRHLSEEHKRKISETRIRLFKERRGEL